MSAGTATDAPSTSIRPPPHHWLSSLAGLPVWTNPNEPAGPYAGGGRAIHGDGRSTVSGRSKLVPNDVVSKVVDSATGDGDAVATAVRATDADRVGDGAACVAAGPAPVAPDAQPAT